MPGIVSSAFSNVSGHRKVPWHRELGALVTRHTPPQYRLRASQFRVNSVVISFFKSSSCASLINLFTIISHTNISFIVSSSSHDVPFNGLVVQLITDAAMDRTPSHAVTNLSCSNLASLPTLPPTSPCCTHTTCTMPVTIFTWLL